MKKIAIAAVPILCLLAVALPSPVNQLPPIFAQDTPSSVEDYDQNCNRNASVEYCRLGPMRIYIAPCGSWFFCRGIVFIIAVGTWAFIDFIVAVTGNMTDKEGRLIKKR